MKHGRGYRLLSQKGAAGHFWLSLVCFSALVIASFLLFEQQIQDFLTHLNLYQPSTPAQKLYLALLLIALLALDVVLPVPSSMVALLAVAMLGSVGGYLAIFVGLCLGAGLGYALGAGSEMLMHADIAIAGCGAKIGQPEINLGTIPGAGGTQRLIRTVGKPLAMKMVLSGEFLTADDALSAGLIAEVTEDEQTLPRTLALAETIAAKSPLALRLAKEAMLKSYELGLEAGLNLERKSFSLLAASEDRREGIAAFKEKRAAQFVGR